MLGYKPEWSAKQIAKHHKKLLKKFPDKHPELKYAHMWMMDRSFREALQSRAPNQLYYCAKAMEHPPKILLNHMLKNTTRNNVTLRKPNIQVPKQEYPCCAYCKTKLAGSIMEMTNFSMVTCGCGTKYSHVNCAEKFMIENDTCILCRQYYTLNIKRNSTLQQTLLRSSTCQH